MKFIGLMFFTIRTLVVATALVSLASVPAFADDTPNVPVPKSANTAAANPVPVFQQTVSLCKAVPAKPNCDGTHSSFKVPPGRELVIEYVSGSCAVDPGTSFSGLNLSTTVGGSVGSHFFNNWTGKTTPDETRGFNFGQQTRIYADADSSVNLGFSLAPPAFL